MGTFKKQEKLRSKQEIDKLFLQGIRINTGPMFLLWNENKNHKQILAKTLISVPKKNIKSATKRNILKRRISEVFRKNKQELYETLNTQNKQINLAIIYKAKEIHEYRLIEEKINLLLNRLKKKL